MDQQRVQLAAYQQQLQTVEMQLLQNPAQAEVGSGRTTGACRLCACITRARSVLLAAAQRGTSPHRTVGSGARVRRPRIAPRAPLVTRPAACRARARVQGLG